MVNALNQGERRGMEMPRVVERSRAVVPRPAQVLVRDSIRRYGTVTAGRRALPDFLIAGTKKGGTTSLVNWLVRHPNVMRMYPPTQKLKSAHYFDMNFHRSEAWYRSHFPTVGARRRREREVDGPVVVGEASPYYMFHPAVPGRVRAKVPDAKIIMLLRDPVARAYSNYWDRRAVGTETLETFEAALDAEAERLATVDVRALSDDPGYHSFHHDHHSYLARGRYLEHIQPWLDLFPRDQLLILSAEHLFAEPADAFAAVERFLGIPPFHGLDLEPFNQRSRPKMLPETYRRLVDYYRPHNEALYSALGEDFGWEATYRRWLAPRDQESC